MFTRSRIARAVPPYTAFLKKYAKQICRTMPKNMTMKQRGRAMATAYFGMAPTQRDQIRALAKKMTAAPHRHRGKTVKTCMSPYALFLKRYGGKMHTKMAGKPMKARSKAIAAAYRALPPAELARLKKDASKTVMKRRI